MVNKVILIGRLGRDPEIRYSGDGVAIANFNLATSEKWTTQDGQKNEKTEWHKIVAFRRLAEICGEYLSKGQLVYIEGKLQTRKWEDQDLNKRWTTEVIANQMQMLGGGSSSAKPESNREEDEIPF